MTRSLAKTAVVGLLFGTHAAVAQTPGLRAGALLALSGPAACLGHPVQKAFRSARVPQPDIAPDIAEEDRCVS